MVTFMSVVRAIHLAACMLLFGNVFFRLFAAYPVFTGANEDVRLSTFDSLNGRFRMLTAWSLAVSLSSGFLWAWIVAARMGGGSLISALHPASLGTLLESTQFGRIWEARLALSIGFVALFVVKSQRTQFAQLLLAVAMLATLSFAGHAGASIGKGHWVHLINDSFHLIAAGVWPAGLAPFAIFLAETFHTNQPYEIPVAALCTQRFSFISLVTVGALAITGAVNGYFLVGTVHGLIATIYGRLLILKVAVFSVMVTIGALNLLLLRPRIVIAVQSAALGESLTLLRLLRRNVMVELSLGAILMILVGVLGVTPPAAHQYMSGDIPHLDNHTASVQALKDL